MDSLSFSLLLKFIKLLTWGFPRVPEEAANLYCVCSCFPYTLIIWAVCSSCSAGFWGCDISMSQKEKRVFWLSVHICDHLHAAKAYQAQAWTPFFKITSRLNLLSGRKPCSSSSVCQSVSLCSKQLAFKSHVSSSRCRLICLFLCSDFCFVCIFFLLWISRDNLYFLSMPWIGSVLADQDTDVWAG